MTRRGDRLRSVAVWLAAAGATGGVWFARNLIHAGNPLPWLDEVGPVDLPGPERTLEGRDPFSVGHYILDPGGIDADAFLEPLRDSLGVAWPAMIVLAVAGMALALGRGRTPVMRVLGAAAITGAVAYLLTPLTASGPEGSAAGFGLNLRYAAPALALGLALLPLDRSLSSPARVTAVTLLFIPLLMTVVLTAEDGGVGETATTWIAVAVALVLVAAPVALLLLGRSRPAAAAAAAVGLIATVAVIGWFSQDDYFRGRYEEGVGYGVGPAVQIADELEGRRIALAGSSGAFLQYGFYGQDLSNHVQYVGEHGPNADFRAFADCGEWRRALNAGDYDYLVTTGELDLNHPAVTTPSSESAWAVDPAAEQILTEGRVTMFRLHGELDPAACLVGRPTG